MSKHNNHFLGELAAVEFECSVSAAELNQAVHDALRPKDSYYDNRHVQELSVDVLGSLEASRKQHRLVRIAEDQEFGEYKAAVVLAMPLQTEQASRAINTAERAKPKRRFNWLKESVEASLVEERSAQTARSPFLAVSFGNDVLLPIAAFEKQSDSETCSYVQLGSEITGDAFFATTLDEENINRKRLVEDLRRSVSQIGLEPKRLADSIQLFISQEINQHKTEVDIAIERQFVRCFGNEIGRGRQCETSVLEFRQNSEPCESDMQLKFVGAPFYPGDSDVNIMTVLARNKQSGQTSFGYVTRGDVYVPLIDANLGFGAASRTNGEQLSASQLQLACELIRMKPDTVKGPNGKEPAVLSRDLLEILKRKSYQEIAAAAFLNGLCSLSTTGNNRQAAQTASQVTETMDFLSYHKRFTAASYMRSLSALEEVDLPALKQDMENSDYCSRQDSELVLGLLGYFVKCGNQAGALVTSLKGWDAELPFEPQSRSSEDLILRFAEMYQSGVEYRGLLRSIKIGSTVGDLAIKAAVARDGSIYTATFSGRPKALEAGSYSKLYACSIDVAKSVDMSDGRIKEVHDTLDVLDPARPRVSPSLTY